MDRINLPADIIVAERKLAGVCIQCGHGDISKWESYKHYCGTCGLAMFDRSLGENYMTSETKKDRRKISRTLEQ